MSDKKKKETKQQKLNRAIAILDKIEYSSDGFVKRYPEPKDYDEAMALLKNMQKEKSK